MRKNLVWRATTHDGDLYYKKKEDVPANYIVCSQDFLFCSPDELDEVIATLNSKEKKRVDEMWKGGGY